MAFWAETSTAARLVFFPPSPWLLPSVLLAARVISLRFCRSPFLLCGFLSASRAAQSAVKSIARAVAVYLGEQAGLFPPPVLSRTHLSSLHPFSFPRLNFLDSEQARSSPSIINFFPFLFIFHAFPPYLPLFPLSPACGGGCGRAPVRCSPAWALDFSF